MRIFLPSKDEMENIFALNLIIFAFSTVKLCLHLRVLLEQLVFPHVGTLFQPKS